MATGPGPPVPCSTSALYTLADAKRPTRSSTHGLARSLPGVAQIGGPVIVATMEDPDRFSDAGRLQALHRAHPQGIGDRHTDRKGGAMSKAGPRRLPDQLPQSANTDRRFVPSGPRSTSPRWSAAPITRRRCASSPPASPIEPESCCHPAKPKSCATSTAHRSR